MFSWQKRKGCLTLFRDPQHHNPQCREEDTRPWQVPCRARNHGHTLPRASTRPIDQDSFIVHVSHRNHEISLVSKSIMIDWGAVPIAPPTPCKKHSNIHPTPALSVQQTTRLPRRRPLELPDALCPFNRPLLCACPPVAGAPYTKPKAKPARSPAPEIGRAYV